VTPQEKRAHKIWMKALTGGRKTHRAKLVVGKTLKVVALCGTDYKFASIDPSDITCTRCKKLMKAR
jgi:hypothetical protein